VIEHLARVSRHAHMFAVRGFAAVGALLVMKGIIGLVTSERWPANQQTSTERTDQTVSSYVQSHVARCGSAEGRAHANLPAGIGTSRPLDVRMETAALELGHGIAAHRRHPRSRGAGHTGSGNQTAMPIRVVVADDSWLIREGVSEVLRRAPEVELVEVCWNGKELELAVSSLKPDVVVTGIRMPPSGAGEGIVIARRLRETNPEVGVVVLSQYVEPSYALGLLDRGTGRRAYLLKERLRSRHDLIGAIEAVAGGGSVLDPMVIDALIQARSRAVPCRLADLTPRERQVLAEIAVGKSNAAIAEALCLTKRAVEKHVNSIFAKLGLADTHDTSRRVKATLLFLAEEDEDAAVSADDGGLAPVRPAIATTR
jgi:DNA-binding NarL/FixJ family response regulator